MTGRGAVLLALRCGTNPRGSTAPLPRENTTMIPTTNVKPMPRPVVSDCKGGDCPQQRHRDQQRAQDGGQPLPAGDSGAEAKRDSRASGKLVEGGAKLVGGERGGLLFEARAGSAARLAIARRASRSDYLATARAHPMDGAHHQFAWTHRIRSLRATHTHISAQAAPTRDERTSRRDPGGS